MKLKSLALLHFISMLFLASLVDLVAQEKVVITPGTRVRLTVPDITNRYGLINNRISGNVLSFEKDTLVIDYQEDFLKGVLDVPITSVKKLEVSRGQKKSRALSGAGIGLVGGFITGYSFAVLTDQKGDVDPRPFYGILGGLVGVVSGAIIGANMGGEQWQKIPLGRIDIGVLPDERDIFAFSLSFAF